MKHAFMTFAPAYQSDNHTPLIGVDANESYKDKYYEYRKGKKDSTVL